MAENGTDIAKAVVMACGSLNPCNVVYEPGLLSFSTETYRTNAFNAYLKKYPAIKVLAEQQGQYLAGPGRAAMQNMLQAHPNINVAASSGDQMTAGMAEAVKSAGDTGKVKLIGNGASTPGVAAVAAGQWFATIANVPYTEGYLGGPVRDRGGQGHAALQDPALRRRPARHGHRHADHRPVERVQVQGPVGRMTRGDADLAGPARSPRRACV